MEIIILPKGISEDLMNDHLENIKSDQWEAIKKELVLIDQNYDFKEVNLGKGTDWIAILVVINTISNVFMLGDKIDKGLDGWIRIGKRIKSLFSKSETVYLDIHSAKLYALQHIAENYSLKSITIENEISIELDNLSGMLADRKETDFIAKPWAIYIITLIINDKNKVILSVRSDGQINELLNSDLSFPTPY